MQVAGSSSSGSKPRSRMPSHNAFRFAALFIVALTYISLDMVELLGGLKEKHFAQSGAQNIPNLRLKVIGQALNNTTKANSNSIVYCQNPKSDGCLWRGAPWRFEIGKWMNLNEEMLSKPVFVTEKIHGKNCLGNCSGNGVCNFELGECRCRHGYRGPSCSELDEYPCNLPRNEEFPFGTYVSSICPATCDTTLARCTCGPRSPYPDRQVVEPCGFIKDPNGTVLWQKPDFDRLYSNDSSAPGWCMADPNNVEVVPREQCVCNDDGIFGQFCEKRAIPYCIAGCSGHGKCSAGHCQCEGGWYGVDCSLPSVETAVTDSPSLWLASEMYWPDHSAEERERKIERLRPLIYVYDVPYEFTSHHLEGRKWRWHCVPWMYSESNETEFHEFQLYGMELALYEAMLASPHRTTNGNDADYFFVPILTACITARASDSPRMSNYLFVRQHLVAKYVLNLQAHISANYPFWDRHKGRDHIWSFPWDEGGCYAPQAIASSIFLSPWGNTMSKYNKSTTAYWEDDWTQVPKYVRGDHPCFMPDKDVVMPAWKHPLFFLGDLERRQRSFDDRPLLFFFSGNMGSKYEGGRPEEGYSMGIRQNVSSYFSSTPDKEGKLGTKTEDGVVVISGSTNEYGNQLASSRFCGVFPGDGFSSRMEDSILHGCIPVIVQDGIQLPWENVLHYDSFSVRINEDDIPNMIQILKNISREEVVSKLENVQKVWQRWTYHSVMKQEAWRQEKWFGYRAIWAQSLPLLSEDDAIDTLMQTLSYKLYNDKWRHKGVRSLQM